MRLALYGGGDAEENEKMDQSLISLAGHANPQITFIPSCYYDGTWDFRDFVRRFRNLYIHKLVYFPIDVDFDSVLLEEAFRSDIIYLSGGNTFYFLNFLRKKKLIGRLKEFVARGGVLAGLSAGAILCTPNIETAGFPAFDRDENEVKIKNLKALNLVDFHFFPHYVNSKRYDLALSSHSKKQSIPTLCSRDGEGIILDGASLSFVGRVTVFHNGKKFSLKNKMKL